MERLREKIVELGFDVCHIETIQVTIDSKTVDQKVYRMHRGRVSVVISRTDDDKHASASASPDGKMQWQSISLEIRNHGCKAKNTFTIDRESDVRALKFSAATGIEWFLRKVTALDALVN